MNIHETFNKHKNNFLFFENKKIQDYKSAILSRFIEQNFDKKNNESLKNVSINKFFNFNYRYNISEEPSFTKKNKDGSYIIVLLNGQCEKYHDENIMIQNLFSKNENDYLNNNLSDKKDFFVDLNSLFLNSGFKLEVKNNKNVKIKITNIITEDNLTVFQRNYFICNDSSNVELIEEYENKNDAINNVYNILNLKKNSIFNHTIIQDNANDHNLILTTFSTCEENALYKQKCYNFSDGYVRNFHFSDLKETNSEVDLQGYFFLKGKNLSNNKTFVSHLAEDCKSNQVYKGILNDHSKATYFSNTYVDSIAQKTEGYQLSKGILLSEDSSFFSKPELKIYADDVKCSHGSTIGPIDENAIFYLRSRGMSKNAATKMIVSSFISEDINSIEDDNISEIIEKKLIRYLSQVKWIYWTLNLNFLYLKKIQI